MRFLVVHIISFAFIVLLVNWFSTICFAESLWKQDPGVISEFCARQGLMYGPAPGYIVTCVPPDKLDQIRKNGLCPSKLFSSGTGINGEFVWLSNEPFYHSQNGNVVLVPIEAAQRHGACLTEGLAGQPGVWRCPNRIPPEELIFGGSSLRGAGLPGQQKKMIWEPPPAASSPTRQILNPLADPPGARPPRPSVTGCTTPRLSGSSRSITSRYSQWLNSSASQCSAGQGLRGAQCASNFVQMMNPYLAPCVDTFQNEVLTGIDELDPTESKFFSNSVCQMTGGIGLGYGLGAAASTCAEFGGVTNTICLSVGATELGAPLAAVGGTAVCAGACVYVAGHGAVNCYNHSPSQGYAPEYGYSTGYFDNACDIYGDLLPEGPPCDDYAKYNFIEELLSYIPSSGPVRRPVCREKRDPITGRMGVDCRR